MENFGDAPFSPGRADPASVAAIAVAAGEVRRAVGLPIGINVLKNDAQAALAVAAAGQVTRFGEPLAETYRREVIGGPGAFVVTAEDRRDIARALRAKLVREIA